MKIELKPFQKVLVRDNPHDEWQADFFKRFEDAAKTYYPYRCIGSSYRECIPYEGNEEFLNTDKAYKEKWIPEEGTLVLASDTKIWWRPGFFVGLNEDTSDYPYKISCLLDNADTIDLDTELFRFIKPFPKEIHNEN